MELIELKIQGISYNDNTSGAFALILDEINGSKKLPIVIGGFEAQAIAIALEKKIKTSRPLTHELFKGFAAKEDRSTMNATFNLVNQDHKEVFDKLSKEANINGINGHISVGGYRASIYNALEIESVKVLIEVMNELKRKV